MEDQGFLEGNDMLEQIDWENLFDGFPDADNIFDTQLPNSSSDSLSFRIEETENLLMNDNDLNLVGCETNQQSFNDFLDAVLVESPPCSYGSVSGLGSPVNGDNRNCDEGNGSSLEAIEEKEKPEICVGGDKASIEVAEEDPDDPVAKKRRRQLRNRDAAVRSRERKKMYVKELELKSRYLEAECMRLGRLLQCFVAENQTLRLSLQKGCAYGVTSAKQESAVLLLESLLLGSLLWFLGITCLFALLPNGAEPNLEKVERRATECVAPKNPRSRVLVEEQCFVRSRRCKASRTKMKGLWSTGDFLLSVAA